MSSRVPGRQSPDPERQSGAQQRDPPSAGKAPDEYKHDPEYAKRESERERSALESNPVHPLDRYVAAKFAR